MKSRTEIKLEVVKNGGTADDAEKIINSPVEQLISALRVGAHEHAREFERSGTGRPTWCDKDHNCGPPAEALRKYIEDLEARLIELMNGESM